MDNTRRPLLSIPDDELLRRLGALVHESRALEHELVTHIAEVDARKLYAREASPSMFSYCTKVLHLSGAEAYLRIAAARASLKHPVLLTMLADGRLNLTTIDLLTRHLTPANRDSLLTRAAYASKREVLKLIAEVAPRPDVPSVMRKLPERRVAAVSGLPLSTTGPLAGANPGFMAPRLGPAVDGGRTATDTVLGPQRVVTAEVAAAAEILPGGVQTSSESEPAAQSSTAVPTIQLRPDGVPHRPVVEPLSPARYKVQFTAGARLHGRLERLQALMRSTVPDGDLAVLIEIAVAEKIERLEARRYGRTKAPRTRFPEVDPDPRSRYVPAASKRTVSERDGDQCCFRSPQGIRCAERGWIEFHHGLPYARGGDRSPQNISLLCHAHNQYLADLDYGRSVMDRHRHAQKAAQKTDPGT
jgi:hypothetical protein